ncbi:MULTISPECIES: hypothetical protein [Acinetobacter]|uniref:hypothetical protein n=1 Tax=Acinetobacter TaxID=469 RepID=UPI002898A661|nr:hypothetical protein [Acinetobacter variabilis]
MILSKSNVIKPHLFAERKIVKGKVKINGIPSCRLVRVYAGIGGRLLAQTLSNKNGDYEFVLPHQPSYVVAAFDHLKNYNAVIQDNVVPK